jgi:kynurenine formamidase
VTTLVDLTHPIEPGMVTYPGLPGPQLGVHLSREDSRAHYGPGTEFEIGTLAMVGNTGTYLDAPWHRYPDGVDLAGLPLERTAALDGVVVDLRRDDVQAGVPGAPRGISALDLASASVVSASAASTWVTGRAVLLHTGWDRRWRTPRYGVGAPFLTADGAAWLVDRGAVLVGIDAVNIDDMGDPARPAHTALLAAGIPVLEHLTGLAALPVTGFTLHAAPLPVRGLGTVAVRAYAVLPAASTGA